MAELLNITFSLILQYTKNKTMKNCLQIVFSLLGVSNQISISASFELYIEQSNIV